MHLLFLLHLLLLLLSPSDQSPTDKISLLSLKSSISADPVRALSRWDLPLTPHCRWPDVTCDVFGIHVTSLDLSGYSLAGVLPAAVANLTELRHLSLRGNNFSDPILGSVTSLRSLKSLDLVVKERRRRRRRRVLVVVKLERRRRRRTVLVVVVGFFS